MAAPVSVIELGSYYRRAIELLTDGERDAVITLIAYDPTAGDLIPGTGGLRKLRIGLDGIGKRGGGRVVYYYHNETAPAFLLALYAKNEASDLSADAKRKLSSFVKEMVADKEMVAEWVRK